MRTSPFLLLAAVTFSACDSPDPITEIEPAPLPEIAEEPAAPAFDPTLSTVRVSSTRQDWNQRQPWEKNAPRKRRSLGAVVSDTHVLTTAEMVTDATYLELETADGLKLAPARVEAVDYEANLALLTLEDADDDFFEALVPLEIAEAPKPGDVLDIVQVESNGIPLVTSGPIQSLDVISNFLPGQFFLAYEVKASMQKSASSFSLPVLSEGKLAGMLTNYNSDDQISDVTATPIVQRFLDDAADGSYEGFPSLGVATTSTDDTNFRSWLKLPEDNGGIYVSTVRKGSAADEAGLEKGDVILTVDGMDIDRQGYYEDPELGRVFWSHLVRGSKGAGDEVTLGVIRDGEVVELTATLERLQAAERLVPDYTYGKAPNFLIKGGLLFQELTRPMLETFGKEWESRAPLDLLDVYENPEAYEERFDRVVFLSGVIATPATVGYEPLRNLIVTEVNGKPVRDIKSLVEAFGATPADGLHSIRFDNQDFAVYLDDVLATNVDTQLLQRGLTKLSRTE
ncbi:PDZ domain-containing protein [Haloferula sp. A504]|uniref:S1C family serine protease n=1 Tax=Haloferula sp. A504 TaxID=3373601 RepID=UPI0031C3ABF0|nr:PDZ domain-containing protein [Verrucomicrobiaceae bacterium E54]